MKKKKILIFSLLIILVIAGIKYSKIKKYFLEERYRKLTTLFTMSGKCFNPNVDLIDIVKLNGFNYKQEDKEVINKSIYLLKNASSNIESKIPLYTHHIYFTYSDKPIKLNDFFIEKIKANFVRLNKLTPNWQHIIWTNAPEIFPDEIKNISGVQVFNIDKFKDHQLYPYLKDSINKGNSLRAYFMQASDTLRLMAVQEFGGIYTDMDYEIYNAAALYSLMKKFDFIGGRELNTEQSYYGNAFIAAKAHHPVIEDAVNKIIDYHKNPASIPIYMVNSCNLLEKLYFTSPPLLTISYFKENNQADNVDVILPAWMIYNINLAREKNGGCSYKVFTREKFKQQDENIERIIQQFSLKYKSNSNNPYLDVYHNPGLFRQDPTYPIIGADMFCATWYENRK